MVATTGAFEPTDESIAKHTVPDWWSDAKFGILVTWGPYSVPAFARPTDSFFAFAEWYWLFQQLDPGELERAFPDLSSALEEPANTAHREYHLEAYGEGITYDALIDKWRGEAWDPDSWIELFEKSGAKYCVAVAKHHDGVAYSSSVRGAGLASRRREKMANRLAAFIVLEEAYRLFVNLHS